MDSKASLLLAIQVRGKHCLVIGAGEVALSRINHFLLAGAKITVIAGELKPVHPEILSLNEAGKLYGFHNRDYLSTDLELYRNKNDVLEIDSIDEIGPQHYAQIGRQVLNEIFANVCCCIDDYDISAKIYYQCKYLGLPVNIADKPPLCDFYFGSMFNQDNVQVMVSTNGLSPRLSRLIKDQIVKEFSGIDLNRAAQNLGLIRARLRASLVTGSDVASIDTRMSWIKDLTDFFTLKQWSELELQPKESDDESGGEHVHADKIVAYYPGFPPRDYDEFKRSFTSTSSAV